MKELKQLLTRDELQTIALVWGLQGPAPHENGHLPIGTMDIETAANQIGASQTRLKQQLISARQKMMAARQQRTIPKDIKLLAGWNGLALSALSKAANLKGGAIYHQAAKGLRGFLVNSLWDGAKLMRARDAHGALGSASLQDYAYVARGLLDWAETSKQAQDFHLLEQIVTQAWQRYFSSDGWRLSEDILIPYGGSEAILADGAMPSPSAVMIETTFRLLKHKPNPQLQGLAAKAIRADSESLSDSPFSYATHLSVLEDFHARTHLNQATPE